MLKCLPCLCILLACTTVALAQDDLAVTVDDLILNSRYQEAVQLLDRQTSQTPSPVWLNKKAEALMRLGELQLAEDILRNTEDQLQRKPDPVAQAMTRTNLGFLQLNRGRFDRAEELLSEAVDALAGYTHTHGILVANAHAYLGLAYMSQGKYTQAQDELHRALAIRRELPKNREAWMAATYNDLGLAYSRADKDRALDFYEQAHNMYRELYGDEDARIAVSSINTGILYRDLELFGDAVANFETALKIANRVYAGAHPTKAIALYNLGQTYLRLNDQESAMRFYDQALKMYKDYYGEKHPEVSSVLNAMGNLRLSRDDFDGALDYYQAALKANVPDFNSADVTADPPLRGYYNGTVLLHTLLFKAQAFEARYIRKSLKFSDLQEALNTLVRCDSLIDQLRHHTTNENDKLALGSMAEEVYGDGVRISHQAALSAFRKHDYYEKAFYFAEKSKAAVLLEAISDTDAKSFAGVPTAMLEEERDLKSSLAVVARKLAERPSAEEEQDLRKTAFDLRNKYDRFIDAMERDYPSYFNLKFNVAAPTIAQIQSLLPSHTAVISYFIDTRNQQLYTFILRNNQYMLRQKSLPANFERYINGLRNGAYFQEMDAFRTSAYELSRLLIPRLPKSVTDLVILPTGHLGLVPFETLLTANPKPGQPYRELPYVIRRYSVRYEFSASLLARKHQKENRGTAPSILLCAPVQFPHHASLADLPGTEQEIRDISTLFTGRNLTASVLAREQAAEQRIKSGALKEYRYLHFATHGIVDEYRPELSRIFLQQDEKEDGDLFAGEIYNLELNAALVTLSACQTGLGKIAGGEGVIGLSRALVYAGAENIVVSFWNVADESTATLMKDFYRELVSGKKENYSRALRHAKLTMISDARHAAPFHWAPFVLIGF